MMFSKKNTDIKKEGVWARPEMEVTFRAEIMPARGRDERTFRISQVLSNGRVRLHDFDGEHLQGAFEPIVFRRKS